MSGAGWRLLAPLALLVAAFNPGSVAMAHDSNCNGSNKSSKIHCRNDGTDTSTSANDISIDVEGISISTTREAEIGRGIEAIHQGTGNITIDIAGTTTGEDTTASTITTTGKTTGGVHANAIYAEHKNPAADASVTITLEDTEITTSVATQNHPAGYGIFALNRAKGKAEVNLNSGVTILTEGPAVSVAQTHHTTNTEAHAILKADSITVTTTEDYSSQGLNIVRDHGVGDAQVTIHDSTITTEGTYGTGIFAARNSAKEGDITISVTNGRTTTGSLKTGCTPSATDDCTIGALSHGINAYQNFYTGNIDSVTGDITITTKDHTIKTTGTDKVNGITHANGVRAYHTSTGNISITMDGGSVMTAGTYSYGLYGDHHGKGKVTITTKNGHAITTTGPNGHGIVGYQRSTDGDPRAIDTGTHPRTIDITVGGPITVDGAGAQGVRVGSLSGSTPTRMAVLDDKGYRRQTVTVNAPIKSKAEGVFLANGGRVIIGPSGSITSASGIAILATGTVPKVPEDTSDPQNPIPAMPAIPPKLRVDLNLGGRRVAQAIGDDWIINDGGGTTIAMNNVVLHDGVMGATGNTAPNGAWNVRMLAEGVKVTDRMDPANWVVSDRAAGVIADRDFSTADLTEIRRPPPPTPPPPEPEPEMHLVDEPVMADASALAGVHVEGDGEVHIGAQGSIRAASGIAILATGDEPDLLVDMDLDGRRVADVIGDDWIINDGGGTTIVVNDVKLHDGTTGVVPGASAPNGAREVRMQAQAGAVRAQAGDVRIRAAGVRVLDRTDPDPANWVVSEPTEGVIADRDFSAADFIEEGAAPPPSRPAPPPPTFVEEYAPRAALYEALPDFLLRLTGPGPTRRCRSAPEEPAWVRFAGGQGAYDADRSTTGATYTLDRFETEGGFSAAFNDTTRGWVSVRHLWGTAGVGSPTGGGTIDVRGLGASVGGAWQSPTGAYALGCFAYMRYNVDFASNHRGLLKAGTNARAHTLDFETGWRVALTEGVQWAPRVWVVGSRVAVDGFTDAVDARVAYAEAARIRGGLGFVADTTRPWGEGTFTLRGSVDLEKLLSGRETRVAVSGESLRATATAHGLLAGLNGVYRQGRFSIGAEFAARQELGSNDSEYASFLNLGVRW